LVDADGRALPADVQRTVLRGLSGDRTALAAVIAGIDLRDAEPLRASLHRLLSVADPQRVAGAVVDLNGIVEAAGADYLGAPPAEFRAVHAVVAALTGALPGR